ncbi:hypothetical protein [Leptolyngbya sp. 7M]|uniref:hypothetical protein n=1 Tax=Leptolyngbya sp. 7M TaxID=2812896 RepID=UPI001B8C00E9|nr:hypothetical protein [Leptolyngbya sp. 7M]QYO63755.1 hypothetical protein JVX88_28535 [Leptolyngbya sp. 7M]
MTQQLNKLTLILALWLCLACMPIDYEGNLVNGYKIVKTSGISFAITYPGTTVLVPEEYITGINVKGDIIFGRIDPLTPELQRLVEGKQHPGYFIVNTKTHTYQLGLGKQEWLDELKKAGVLKEPILYNPVYFSIF